MYMWHEPLFNLTGMLVMG